MTIRCSELRDRLTAARGDGDAAGSGSPRDARLEAEHLASCPACAAYAERLAAFRSELRQRHADIRPGAGFAAQVVSRLDGPPDLLGWAALRLLPATLALVLVLSGWCLLRTPSPTDLLTQAPTDDVLSWVVSTRTGEP